MVDLGRSIADRALGLLRISPLACRVLAAASALFVPTLAIASDSAISTVSVSRPFFNPTLGQKIGISFTLANSGTLDVLILDRDGYLVRELVAGKAAEKGVVSLDWDGRDAKGYVVPDEAYSLKIDFTSPAGKATYFPGNEAETDVKVMANSYDRQTAVFSYKLPRPARVHIQAGVAVLDPKTKEPIGPVMRTLVNREPRPSGAVVEPGTAWTRAARSSSLICLISSWRLRRALCPSTRF